MHRAHCAPWPAAGPQRVPCSPPAPASLPLPGPSEAVPRRASPCRQPKPLPTSARALGGPLFRDHKAALILCSAPSHVTRGGGPRAPAASAALRRCWGECSAPFVPPSLAPVAGGPSGGAAARQPPVARRQGREQQLPGAPGLSPPAGGTAPRPRERGGRSLVSTRGPDFRLRSRRKGLCAATAISL